ncbi:hypothetical protein FRC04_011931 [Tulasnella sp. 424]|nr:hypothetical protein FRC04_011931 [Tulasnella sp. 424]KAG8970093.1 hypothetical protein FRC05_000741 [Tulasnella sp. 425]
MILPHAHRIRSFICTFNEDSVQLVAEVATRAAHTLRNLGIFSSDGSVVNGIPFDGMPWLEKLELLDIYWTDSMWWRATGLRVVKLAEMPWVPEVSAFLDFLEASVNLERFYYSLKENVFDQEALGPQTLPASQKDVIILPNLTHFTAYSIPASHVQVILQRVSFPPHSHFNATTADTFPPEENQFNFIVPVVNHLVALRPPSSLALEFNGEDAYITAAEQRWRLGFYNDGLDINPRELSYRMLLQAIPSEIRAFIHSVLVVELKSQEDNAEWLVEALSDDEINITTFECPLDEDWMDVLWVDESSGWAGFRLPALQSLTFNICIYTMVVSIITIKGLLQVRSAVMPHLGLHELDVMIRVPKNYDEGEIKAALDDPQLLNLGAQVERVPEDETDSAEALQELDERRDAEDEDEDEGFDGDELTLEHRAE